MKIKNHWAFNKETFLLRSSIPSTDLEAADKHYETLKLHVRSVIEFGLKMGIPEDHISKHDESKLQMVEFLPYARNFHGDGDSDGFATAWLHHLHHNPHHWQHWIFPDNYTPKGSNVIDGCVPMPLIYVREMIADWHGAEFTYANSWDISKWLFKAMPKIRVHPQTAGCLREELDGLGYADVVYMQHFGSEAHK